MSNGTDRGQIRRDKADRNPISMRRGGISVEPVHKTNDKKGGNFSGSDPEKCKKGTVVLVPCEVYFRNPSSARIDLYLEISVICR